MIILIRPKWQQANENMAVWKWGYTLRMDIKYENDDSPFSG
jgi:hypothetical protein